MAATDLFLFILFKFELTFNPITTVDDSRHVRWRDMTKFTRVYI